MAKVMVRGAAWILGPLALVLLTAVQARAGGKSRIETPKQRVSTDPTLPAGKNYGKRYFGKPFSDYVVRFYKLDFGLPQSKHPSYAANVNPFNYNPAVRLFEGQDVKGSKVLILFYRTDLSNGTRPIEVAQPMVVPRGKAFFVKLIGGEGSIAEGFARSFGDDFLIQHSPALKVFDNKKALEVNTGTFQNDVYTLDMSIDGKPVKGLYQRTQTPFFEYEVSKTEAVPAADVPDDFVQVTGTPPYYSEDMLRTPELPAGTKSLGVADGNYAMIPPLEPGIHEVKILATDASGLYRDVKLRLYVE